MNLIMIAILLAVVTISIWTFAYFTPTEQCRTWVDLQTSSIGPGCVSSGR